MPARHRLPLFLLAFTGIAFLVLGWAPVADRFTWFMECFPVLLGAPILAWTYGRFPFTPLLYVLMTLHALVLMVGGHWTYAEVPAGHWVKAWLHLARNPYDRLGHLFQGFVPVLLFREILLRRGVLKRGAWSVVVLLFMALGLSATYELLEWLTAVATGEKAEAFLGTQGDPWDTQWDMACALIGASLALLGLARLQDRQIDRLPSGSLPD